MKEDSSTPKEGLSDDDLLDAVLANAPRPPRLSPDFRARLEAALAAEVAEEHARATTGIEPKPGRQFRRPAIIIAPAICLLLAMLFFLDPNAREMLAQLVGRAMARSVVTQIGKLRSIPLADESGSTILLNSDSALRIWTEGLNYHVDLLKGEALFDMRHPRKHLVVTVRNITVVDTGTLFAVQIGDDGALRVTVEEGAVQLSEPDLGQTSLSREEQIVVKDHHHPLGSDKKRLSAPQIARLLSWRNGSLSFECEWLVSAAQQLNRYNLTKIEVANSAVGRLPIGGTFDLSDPLAFAHMVTELYPDVLLEESRAADGSRVIRLRPRPGRGIDSPTAPSGCEREP